MSLPLNTDQPSIFVSIASFCDKQLQFTLNGLFTQAKHPGRLRVGVLDQSKDDNRSWIDQQVFSQQVRYIQVDPLDSRGVSWARSVVFSLYEGEQYLLQIDSHTLFDPGWDESLISQLSKLLTWVDKPILTTYPPPFEFDEQGRAMPMYEKDESLYVLRPSEKPELNNVLTPGKSKLAFEVKHHLSNVDYLPGYHVGGNFMFTLGSFVQDVPYDPYMYFLGEEQNLAIRAYTHGYTLFHPRHKNIPLYHLYKQQGVEYEGQHWRKDLDAQRKVSYKEMAIRSDLRLNQLTGGGLNMGAFGLGSQKSLLEFCRESGLNYVEHQLGPQKQPEAADALVRVHALHGDFMVLRNDLSIGLGLRRYGVWAEGLLRLALSHITPGDSVVEVGSTYGEHAVPMSYAAGGAGQVIAMEANPLLARLLSANLLMNRQVEAVALPQAVGDVSCPVAIPEIDLKQLGIYSRLSLSGPGQGTVGIQANTIDALNLTRLNLLKINVNGLEHLVLKGAAATIQKTKPVILISGEQLRVQAIASWASEQQYSVDRFDCDCYGEGDMKAFRHRVPMPPVEGEQGAVKEGIWNPRLEVLLLKPIVAFTESAQ